VQLAVSIEGTNLVADFEGERLCPYRDVVGVWTIGYGHTAGVGPHSKCLSHAEAIATLHRDLDVFSKAVVKLAPKDATVRQFNAVTSLAFNVGAGAVAQSTLVREWRANHDAAAAAQFKRWNRAGGRELLGLTRRRRVECELFVRGSSKAVRRSRPC
jgi:lysozyme